MADKRELENTGFCWERKLLPDASIVQLREALDTDQKPGNRLDVDEFAAILPLLAPIVTSARKMLPDCNPVRALVFNKSTETNWAVGWHQDRVIAVRERQETDGYNNWTQKSGVWHCEPPIEILESMVFARVHLDASTTDNGCLEVAMGSHQNGRVEKKDIKEIIKRCEIESCEAIAGDVLFAKALITHRSKPSNSSDPRLALRIDFASKELPTPLEWGL